MTLRFTRVIPLAVAATAATAFLLTTGAPPGATRARPPLPPASVPIFEHPVLGPDHGPIRPSDTAGRPDRPAFDHDPAAPPPSAAEVDAWIDGVLAEQQPTEALEAVEACVNAEMAQTHTPGASVAIMHDGKLIFARGFGFKAVGDEAEVETGTMFRIGSTTKMMIAAGVLQQVEAGKLDLREPITTYLPELDLDDPWDPETITLHHLMTHSAGIPDRISDEDLIPPPIDPHALADWATTLGDWPLYAPPGSFWNYSNPSWSLAGLILETKTGEPYRDYVKQKVWIPAGMPLTTFEPNDVMEHGNYSFGHEIDPMTGGILIDPNTGKPVVYAPNSYDSGTSGPAGFAFSTPTEMVTWANLLMNEGMNGDTQVLAKSSAAAMQGQQMYMDYTPDDYYGYGVFLSKYRGVQVRDHGGNIPGWSSQLIWVPEHKFAVSVLANTVQSLSGSAYCAVREVLALPPTPPEDYSTDSFTWQKYAGTYDTRLNDGRMFTIWVTWKDDELEAVFDLPADISPVPLRGPLVQAALDTFQIDFEQDGTPDLQFTFIDDPANPGPIKFLRHRAFVGIKGPDRPVPTPAPTDAATATEGATPTATTSPTPRPTQPPRPAYLPLAIKDPPCTPVESHIDVVFVIDGSSYMKAFRGGQMAWDIALDNARTLVGNLDFTPDARGQADRVGAVVYRHRDSLEADEQLGLSGDPNAALAFLGRLSLGNPRDTSRIDKGMEYGRNILLSGRASRPQNKPVMVVISELQAKNVPYEQFPDCEERSNGNEECAVLKLADAIKASGITIVVFATGTTNRGGQMLPGMASDRATLFFERPSADQIRGVFQRLAPRTECPRNTFWPYLP